MKNDRRGKLTVGQKKDNTKAKTTVGTTTFKTTVGTTTFKTKVLIINADTVKGLVYGFQQ